MQIASNFSILKASKCFNYFGAIFLKHLDTSNFHHRSEWKNFFNNKNFKKSLVTVIFINNLNSRQIIYNR